MFPTNNLLMILMSLLLTLHLSAESPEVIITPEKNPVRGALIDGYSKELMIIHLPSPADMIKEALTPFQFQEMPESEELSLRLILGSVEKESMKRFNGLVEELSELIPVEIPIEEEPKIPITLRHQTRTKRSPIRAFMTLLRVMRPVTRVVPAGARMSRYAKFLKAVKYTGYAASAAVISFEIADAFGLVPDARYEALKEAMLALQENREKDLDFMGNMTLITLTSQEKTLSQVSRLRETILNSKTSMELYLKGVNSFNQYISQLQFSLLLLNQGHISSSLLSIDNQRMWLENKLPTPLLRYIGTITPTFKVRLAGFDEKNNNIFISIDVPNPDTGYQLLNFVQWEPFLKIGDDCYTSSIPFVYIAYKPILNSDAVTIRDPLILNPDSCLNDGFILCETDSLLTQIPYLFKNYICKQNTERQYIRGRRSVEKNYFDVNIKPNYNISKIVKDSMMQTNSFHDQTNLTEYRALIEELRKMRDNNTKQTRLLKEKLEENEQHDKYLKLAYIISSVLGFVIIMLIGTGMKYLQKKIQQERQTRENFHAMQQLNC
ncbi:MAG: hypothetical protein GuXV1_gp3 [Guiyang xinmovirus 1]|nr:MAG: hypothetical protein GuXV1_gp3 [Guiyang xinmovirus 1]